MNSCAVGGCGPSFTSGFDTAFQPSDCGCGGGGFPTFSSDSLVAPEYGAPAGYPQTYGPGTMAPQFHQQAEEAVPPPPVPTVYQQQPGFQQGMPIAYQPQPTAYPPTVTQASFQLPWQMPAGPQPQMMPQQQMQIMPQMAPQMQMMPQQQMMYGPAPGQHIHHPGQTDCPNCRH